MFGEPFFPFRGMIKFLKKYGHRIHPVARKYYVDYVEHQHSYALKDNGYIDDSVKIIWPPRDPPRPTQGIHYLVDLNRSSNPPPLLPGRNSKDEKVRRTVHRKQNYQFWNWIKSDFGKSVTAKSVPEPITSANPFPSGPIPSHLGEIDEVDGCKFRRQELQELGQYKEPIIAKN